MPPRRSPQSVRVVLAAGAALLLCAMAPSTQIGRWTVTQSEIPPIIRELGRGVRQGAAMTEEVLQRSDIREVRDYRAFLDGPARRAPSKFAQLSAVNTYVNAHVRTISDLDLYLVPNFWAPPINTLTIGGDCEDIALVKYWGLTRLGFPADSLYLLLGVSTLTTPPEGHAVLGVRLPDGSTWQLDNLETKVVAGPEQDHFEPAYAVNAYGFWTIDEAGRPDNAAWRDAFARALARTKKP